MANIQDDKERYHIEWDLIDCSDLYEEGTDCHEYFIRNDEAIDRYLETASTEEVEAYRQSFHHFYYKSKRLRACRLTERPRVPNPSNGGSSPSAPDLRDMKIPTPPDPFKNFLDGVDKRNKKKL